MPVLVAFITVFRRNPLLLLPMVSTKDTVTGAETAEHVTPMPTFLTTPYPSTRGSASIELKGMSSLRVTLITVELVCPVLGCGTDTHSMYAVSVGVGVSAKISAGAAHWTWNVEREQMYVLSEVAATATG
jgi:hypothetical protein